MFIGAVAIVYASFRALNIEQMTVSEGALREGLIYDLLGRIYNQDIRSETSSIIAKRYHTDQVHAQNIKDTVHYIAAQLSDLPCFIDNENLDALQFLDWAVELHEIGLEIAHSQYHKHSAYIIENGDLAGFSKQDQLVLSKLVRCHRKKLNLKHFAELPLPWRDYAPHMIVIFRLARLLHRSRRNPRPDFKIHLKNNQLRLKFPADWLEQSPLTHADLEQESLYLKTANFDLIFE